MKCERCGQEIEPEVIPPAGTRWRNRPYDEQIADVILAHIASGLSLKTICDTVEGMPTIQAVLEWRARIPSFADKYVLARADSADVMADEILAIADDRSEDWVQDAETGTWKPNHDHINRSKLRVEARKWAASKLKPQSYGERVEAVVSGELSHKHAHVHIDASKIPAEQREQLRGTLLQIVGRRGGGDGGGRDDEG